MRKILVIRNDRFGEFLLNIPALRAIKETYPLVELHLAVSAGVVDLAKAVPCVDRVSALPARGLSLFDQIKIVLDWRQEKFEAAFVLNPSAQAHQMLFWAGVPLRAGYARKHSFFLTHAVADRKGLGQQHEVDNNLDLVALLGCAASTKSLTVNIPAELDSAVMNKFGLGCTKGCVAVHPWTSDPVKQWPLERFEQLIALLAKDSSRKVVIIGRPEPWHESLVVQSADNVIDLSGVTSLLEAAAVLKHCAVLVSCDSGPVHLASSVGTPVIALFRNDLPGKNPERWGPWPQVPIEGRQGNVVVQKASLEDIAVEDVLGQVLELVKETV